MANSNGPTTDKSGQIVAPPKQNGPGEHLVTFLQRMSPEIKRALPKHVTPDRMARIVMTALRTTRELIMCTPPSFAACVMQASQLGLEPNTPLGHAWLIPRRNKNLGPNDRECTLIVGYQGFIELALRSGKVTNIFAHVVRAGDQFQYQLGLYPDLKHTPSDDPKREEMAITHVYAVAVMAGTDVRKFEVLTRAQIEKRRKRSAASGSGPWVTDYEAMCKKTAVRALWPWLPKSAEMAVADALDVRADLGKSQSSVFETSIDPVVAQELEKHGLLASGEPEEELEPAVEYDRETGEVDEAPPLQPSTQVDGAADQKAGDQPASDHQQGDPDLFGKGSGKGKK